MKTMFSFQDGKKDWVTLLTGNRALRKEVMPKADIRLNVIIR